MSRADSVAAATPNTQAAVHALDVHIRLAKLYEGRRDIQGTETGGYLERPVNWGYFNGHLQGHFGLGIYPLMEDGTCSFAVVDVDKDDLDSVLLLRRLLHDHGIPAIVIRSRKKRYHVTVFFDERVDAGDVRRVLRALATEAGLSPKTELFPKADHAAPDSKAAGGYIRLPYLAARAALSEDGRRPRHVAQPGRRVALSPDTPLHELSLEEFLDLAEASRVAPDSVLAAVSDLGVGDEPELPDRAHGGRHRNGHVANRHVPVEVTIPGVALPEDPSQLGLSAEMTALVEQGWSKDSKYRSRSEAEQAVRCALVNRGFPQEDVDAVLTYPKYGISARALSQSPRKRQDSMTRGFNKAVERVRSTSRVAQRGLIDVDLHRAMVARRLPALAWPVLAEVVIGIDGRTGLSYVTARSIAKRLGHDHTSIYRSALKPLRDAGILQAVPLPRSDGGRFDRVAHRVALTAPAPALRAVTADSAKAVDGPASSCRLEGQAPGGSVRVEKRCAKATR